MPAGAGAARRAYRDRRSVTAIHELIEVTRSSRLTALCAIFLSSGMPVFVGYSTFFRIPEAAEDPESGHCRSPDRVFPRGFQPSSIRKSRKVQDLDSREGGKEDAKLAKWLELGSVNPPIQSHRDHPDLKKWMDEWGKQQ